MKKYEKPEIVVTTYKSEPILLVSGGVQKSFDNSTVKFKDLSF